jgi:hypothetical protein
LRLEPGPSRLCPRGASVAHSKGHQSENLGDPSTRAAGDDRAVSILSSSKYPHRRGFAAAPAAVGSSAMERAWGLGSNRLTPAGWRAVAAYLRQSPCNIPTVRSAARIAGRTPRGMGSHIRFAVKYNVGRSAGAANVAPNNMGNRKPARPYPPSSRLVRSWSWWWAGRPMPRSIDMARSSARGGAPAAP